MLVLPLSMQVDYRIMTALIVAAYKGHVEVVQMLLQSGKVHVDQKDSEVCMLYIYEYFYFI